MRSPHAFLLVEDNPADVIITQRALRESGLEVELIVVRDGQEAVEYLVRREPRNGEPWRCPDLILLDVNLPRMSGRDVLLRIRGTAGVPPVPVLVLSTSARQEDIEQLYRAGANTYFQKPQEFPKFVEVLRTIHRYWFGAALLPPQGP